MPLPLSLDSPEPGVAYGRQTVSAFAVAFDEAREAMMGCIQRQ